jgi:hypothetical protein
MIQALEFPQIRFMALASYAALIEYTCEWIVYYTRKWIRIFNIFTLNIYVGQTLRASNKESGFKIGLFMNEWGFLRETAELAKKSGKDKDTGLHRTGLEEYLKVILPEVNDWIHDKMLCEVNGKIYRSRPDYRSEQCKTIIEFDGLQHYTKPDIIEKDIRLTNQYEDLGYKVVRIPYFIQLTRHAVKTLFNVDVKIDLFDGNIPSLGINGLNTPAYLCPAGVKRMAEDFKRFPEQYKTNMDFLKRQNDPYKSGVEFLENEYNKK